VIGHEVSTESGSDRLGLRNLDDHVQDDPVATALGTDLVITLFTKAPYVLICRLSKKVLPNPAENLSQPKVVP